MIDWDKSAKYNGITVEDLKARIEQFPNSAKKLVVTCDRCIDPEERLVRIYQLNRSGSLPGELCNKCAMNHPDRRKRISEAGIGNTRAKGNSGRKFTDEHRKAISIAKIGKKFTDEHRKAISIARIGKYMGKNSPSWQGGISFGKYCNLFNMAFKNMIRERFHNICFLCGKTKEQEGKNLAVHHVNYDKDCICNRSCEFVPLCTSCHSKTSGKNNRKYWEDLIMGYLYPNSIVIFKF